VHVDADDEAQAATARDALARERAVNIEDRVEEWRSAGWRSPPRKRQAAGSMSGVVHRQEVSIQGVRVYGHVVVVPFEDLADDFRADYQARYAAQGSTYEDFDLAYRYGHALASDTRFDGRNWDEIETRHVPNGNGVIRKAAGSGSRAPCDMPGHAPHGSERWRLAARDIFIHLFMA
jgi:hypothetical protein